MSYFSKKNILITEASILISIGIFAPLPAQALGSISGISWNDANGNKIKDAAENTLSGWQLELIDQSGSIVQTTTTNELGFYQFSDLVSGPYIVREILPTNWQQTAPSFITQLTLGQVLGNWSYIETESHVGMYDWETIAPDANGNFQTPINLTGSTVDLSEWLHINYQPTELEKIFNNGHSIEAEYPHDNNNHIVIGGEEFELKQLHFHASSEHQINGSSFGMELHLVHKHQDGGLTVLGLLLEEGEENPALTEIFDNLSLLQQTGDEVLNIADFDASVLLPEDFQGFFYTGSLTTPPATEGVNWFVFNTPIKVSSEHLQAYQQIALNAEHPFYPGNRPLQELNGRQLNELNYQITVSEDTAIENLNFGNTRVPEPSSILGLLTLGGFFVSSKFKHS